MIPGVIINRSEIKMIVLSDHVIKKVIISEQPYPKIPINGVVKHIVMMKKAFGMVSSVLL